MNSREVIRNGGSIGVFLLSCDLLSPHFLVVKSQQMAVCSVSNHVKNRSDELKLNQVRHKKWVATLYASTAKSKITKAFAINEDGKSQQLPSASPPRWEVQDPWHRKHDLIKIRICTVVPHYLMHPCSVWQLRKNPDQGQDPIQRNCGRITEAVRNFGQWHSE